MVKNGFNKKLFILLTLVHITAMLCAPLLISYYNLYYIMLLVPSILLTNTTWALIHEGIHSNLNSDKSKNLLYSRILSLCIHSNFEVLRFGHLMHHRYNRTDYDLTEGYEPATNGNFFTKLFIKLKNNLLYYLHISIGLYLFEVLGPLFLSLPKKVLIPIGEEILGTDHGYVTSAKAVLLKPKRYKRISFDNLLNILIMALIIYLYGQYFYIYLMFLCFRAFLISSVDNLPHYGASLDRIDGAFNLKANRFWQYAILNFNLHRVHHRYPNVAWHLLPEYFDKDSDYYDYSYAKQYLRQWLGVISKKDL